MFKIYKHNYKPSVFISLTLMLICSIAMNAGAQADNFRLKFKTPENVYRPIPFWHLNGQLDSKEIQLQLNDTYHKDGFGGVALLPVSLRTNKQGKIFPGTKPAFLTDDYFNYYREILDISKKENKQVILYDDNDFPSGNAGFDFVVKYPQLSVRQLSMIEFDVAGEKQLHEKVSFKGELVGVVSMNVLTKERFNITGALTDSLINWNAPKGSWKVMVFYTERPEEKVVDYFNPAAVDTFFSMTYQKYDQQLKPYLGSTIRYSYSDDVGFWTFPRAWTKAMNGLFEQRTGLNALLSIPALFHNIGPSTESIKISFFSIRSQLLAEGYNRKVAEWDTKHGMKSLIHPPGNYEPTSVGCHGDIFEYYKYTQVPMMDLISGFNNGRPGFKLVSSAADMYNRPVVASEIYGAFTRNTDSTMLYKAAMNVFARGVNFLIPHGMWYRPDSMRIPPLISHYNSKLAPALAGFNTWAARSMYLLRGGKRVSDIAILWPIHTLEAWFGFEAGRNKSVFNDVPPEFDYRKISDMLTGLIRRDFTFIHPQKICTDRYKIAQGKLVLDNSITRQEYSVIMLPSIKFESVQTIKKLLAFYESGGKIIATGILPYRSIEIGRDKEIVGMITKIFGVDPINLPNTEHQQKNKLHGMAVYLPVATQERLEIVLHTMTPLEDVVIQDVKNLYDTSIDPLDEKNNTTGMFSYIHKVMNGKQIYFFTNSTENAINTNVTVKGKWKLNRFDPYTGTISKWTSLEYIQDKSGNSFTKFPLILGSVSSVFAVSE